MQKTYLIAALLLAIAIPAFIFYPVTDFHEFNHDDSIHITGNELMKEIEFSHILDFWKQSYKDAYTPLTYTLWAIPAAFQNQQGPKPPPEGTPQIRPDRGKFKPELFHALNYFVHLAATAAVFGLLWILIPKVFPVFVGTLIFALHPIQVEAIGWITGLRDSLAGLTCIISVIFYCLFARLSNEGTFLPRANRKKALVYFSLSALFFVLGMFAKPSVFSLPFILAVLGFYYFRRTIKQLAWELAPWVILPIPYIKFLSSLNAGVADRVVFKTDLWIRPFVALDAIAFYLYKIIFPLHFSIDYGRTPQYVLETNILLLTSTITLVICFCLWQFRKYEITRWLTLCFAIFVAGLLPVLGFIPFIFQHISTVGDRYVYISMIGISILVAWVLSEFATHKSYRYVALGVLVILGFRASSQLGTWKDNMTLYNHTVKVNPRSWLAYGNLGGIFEEKQLFDRALLSYEFAVKHGNFPKIWQNIGAVSLILNMYPEAIRAYSEAIKLNPMEARAFNNLGVAWIRYGDLTKAKKSFETALALDPKFFEAQRNLTLLDDKKLTSKTRLPASSEKHRAK